WPERELSGRSLRLADRQPPPRDAGAAAQRVRAAVRARAAGTRVPRSGAGHRDRPARLRADRARQPESPTGLPDDGAAAFACGGTRRGQSLVVWAIWEGLPERVFGGPAARGVTNRARSPGAVPAGGQH